MAQGIMGMKPGEQRQLFLKAEWGYGEDGVCFEGKDDEEENCLVPPDSVSILHPTHPASSPNCLVSGAHECWHTMCA